MAVAYHFCLSLPAVFSQSDRSLFADPCKAWGIWSVTNVKLEAIAIKYGLPTYDLFLLGLYRVREVKFPRVGIPKDINEMVENGVMKWTRVLVFAPLQGLTYLHCG